MILEQTDWDKLDWLLSPESVPWRILDRESLELVLVEQIRSEIEVI